MSATTQVKVSSLEILHYAQGQGLHNLETYIESCIKGEHELDVPGSKSVAGKRTVHIGTWENQIAPQGSIQGAEEATRMYGDLVVGLTHSRGVNRVIPVEFCKIKTLEGVSSLKGGGAFGYAIH